MTLEQAQELWTQYLETGALSPDDENALLQELQNHPDWREKFLKDKRLHGSLGAHGRNGADAAAFQQSVTDRLAAEGNGQRFVSGVRRKIQNENVQPVQEGSTTQTGVPSARRSKVLRSARFRNRQGGWPPALSIAAVAALALLGILIFVMTGRKNDVAIETPPVKTNPIPPLQPEKPQPPTQVLQAIAKIVSAEGDGVTVMFNGERKPLTAGAEIFSGSEIACGANGFATLAFTDGTQVDIQSDSLLNSVVDGPKDGKRIALRSGTISATVTKQPADRPFIVSTETAQLTVVGTVFDCSVEPGSTVLDVLEGTVRLTRTNDGSNLNVQAGQYAVADTTVPLAIKTREKSSKYLVTRGGPIEALDFSPDGSLLALGSYDGAVRVWNPQGNEPPKEFKLHKDRVRAVQFSHDGTMIASASWDKTARIVDASTGAERFKMTCTGKIWAMDFSHDDRTLATGDFAKKLKLWDTTTGKARPSFDPNVSEVIALDYSNNGRFLAASGTGGNIRIFDATTFVEKKYLHGEGVIESIIYSPDDRLLAAAQVKDIRLWDVSTGKVIKTFSGHTDIVRCVRFSIDGQTLFSCSDDKTVRVWDVRSGNLITTLTTHKAKVSALAVSPKGDVFASAGWGQQVKIWRIDALPKN